MTTINLSQASRADMYRAKAEHLQQYFTGKGITIYTAETAYGSILYTLERDDGGHIWTPEVLRINGIRHVLAGSYTLGERWDYENLDYVQRTVAHLAYNALRRESGDKDPTTTATRSLEAVLGEIILPVLESHADEVAQTERELAAQTWEGEADLAETRGAREMENAVRYRQTARSIREGASYKDDGRV